MGWLPSEVLMLSLSSFVCRLSQGTMICGWDQTGPQIYYVDSDGERLHGSLFSVGSGSTFAYGVLDTGYRFDMTFDEAVALGQRSIFAATYRDAYSGGTVRGATPRRALGLEPDERQLSVARAHIVIMCALSRPSILCLLCGHASFLPHTCASCPAAAMFLVNLIRVHLGHPLPGRAPFIGSPLTVTPTTGDLSSLAARSVPHRQGRLETHLRDRLHGELAEDISARRFHRPSLSSAPLLHSLSDQISHLYSCGSRMQRMSPDTFYSPTSPLLHHSCNRRTCTSSTMESRRRSRFLVEALLSCLLCFGRRVAQHAK
uniref:proteasome endopeptidase complex n=1 Tax=Chrysotila carterae TaxID=13221 RepID=A0A7S4B4X0_CHRCT